MLELTEALLHNARVVILEMTHATQEELNNEKDMVRHYAYEAGLKANRDDLPVQNDLPSLVDIPYYMGVCQAQSNEDFEEENKAIEQEWEKAQARMMELRVMYPDASEPRWLYCPHGHNVVFSKAGYDECAACGSIMTEAAEERYYETLVAVGQCM